MSIIMNIAKLPTLNRGLWHLRRAAMCSIKGITMEYERDPQPLFTDAETQRLLRSMTQMQLNKVFRKKTVPNNNVEYKFMTREDLEDEFLNTIQKAKERLQMPPVVQVKKDENKIISVDTALQGFSNTKFVITDITYGLKQSERKVVVRQMDGTLEYAPYETAKRMNQIYFPLAGRQVRIPRMFEDEHFKRCLDEHKYEFILDRLAVQYEPYEQDYHRLSSRLYQHLNESKEFDVLRSTRHFGPMAFFYAWHRCIDDLLYDMIRRDYLRNGVELIALMHKIHAIPTDHATLLQRLDNLQANKNPALEDMRKSLRSSNDDIHEEIKSAIGKSREDFEMDDLCLKFIDQYIAEHAHKKVQLELAVQTLREINAEKKQLFEGLSKVHGVQ